VVVTCEAYHQERLETLAKAAKVPYTRLGTVGGRRLIIKPWLDVTVADLNEAWRMSLAKHLAVA
jgi:hypothetical protein